MNGPKVCVVGASNIDLISYVPRLPALGETLHGTRFSTGFGGKGANQAVMAAKLGAEVVIVTKLGRDDFGDRTLDNFRRFGIDVGSIAQTDDASTGVRRSSSTRQATTPSSSSPVPTTCSMPATSRPPDRRWLPPEWSSVSSRFRSR
jgi:sugar/nucleoside kinase (ribokinase family)